MRRNFFTEDQAPVVQTLDSAIHWINHYPLDNSIGFASFYPLDSDLSGGQRYPSFEQLGPDAARYYIQLLSGDYCFSYFPMTEESVSTVTKVGY